MSETNRPTIKMQLTEGPTPADLAGMFNRRDLAQRAAENQQERDKRQQRDKFMRDLNQQPAPDDATDEDQQQSPDAEAEQRAAQAEARLVGLNLALEYGLDLEGADILASVSDPDAARTIAQRLAGTTNRTKRK